MIAFQDIIFNIHVQVDYFERAKREVEIPLLKKQYEEQKEKDRQFHEEFEEERVSRAVGVWQHQFNATLDNFIIVVCYIYVNFALRDWLVRLNMFGSRTSISQESGYGHFSSEPPIENIINFFCYNRTIISMLTLSVALDPATCKHSLFNMRKAV